MLDTLRDGAKSWIAKLLLSILVLSFAAWGIADVFRSNFVGNTVLTAGKTVVTPVEYRLAYARQLQIAQQQMGARLTAEQARLIGLDGQVTQQMIAGIVLDEQARVMDLGLSKDRLAALTGDDPAFKGNDGSFSRGQFDAVLRNVGMRPEDYLKSREKIAVRQQIVDAVTDGLPVPKAYLSAIAQHDGENRTVDFLTIPASIIPAITTVDEPALTKFFEERKESYRAPEYRKFSFVRLLPDDIADVKTIADTDVQADYDKYKSRYTTPETRTIEQLVFANVAAAKAAKEKITGGSAFEDIVKLENKAMSDVSLGVLTKAQVPDTKIAEAAFSVATGAVSDVIAGQFGPVLVRVTAIAPEVVQPFESVKEQIRKDLALNEAANQVLDVHDAYEDARGGGDTLQAAAEKVKLKAVTVDALDTTSQTPDGKTLKDIPEAQNLVPAVFQAEEGAENAPLNAAGNGFIWYEVEKITPARDRPLSEVRDRVVADWKTATINDRLAAKAEEIRKAVAGGKTLDAVATELSLTKGTKRGIKRDSDDPDLGADGVEAAFGGGVDHVAAVANAAGDQQTILKVIEAFDPTDVSESALPENRKVQTARGLADDLLEQLVARLQETYPVTVNEAALQASIQSGSF
jgi:peptidyl-prolyl cis-trans isomerase D